MDIPSYADELACICMDVALSLHIALVLYSITRKCMDNEQNLAFTKTTML